MLPLVFLGLGLLAMGGGGSEANANVFPYFPDGDEQAPYVPDLYPDLLPLHINPDALDAPYVVVPVGRTVHMEGGGRILSVGSRALDSMPPHQVVQSGGVFADYLMVRFGEPGRWQIDTRAEVGGATWPNNEINRHWNLEIV